MPVQELSTYMGLLLLCPVVPRRYFNVSNFSSKDMLKNKFKLEQIVM